MGGEKKEKSLWMLVLCTKSRKKRLNNKLSEFDFLTIGLKASGHLNNGKSI